MAAPYNIQGVPMAPKVVDGPQGKPVDTELWNRAKEFEGVFLSQFTTTLRTSSLKSGLFGDSIGRETYEGMFSEALGRQLAQQGALGLTHPLYRSLGGRYAPLEPLSTRTRGAAAAEMNAALSRQAETAEGVTDTAENHHAP
jgi:Rod binding domain-containing protein